MKIFVIPLLVLFAGCATEQPKLWTVSSIAESPASTIRLLDKNKEVIGHIDRTMAQKLLEIKDKIEDVSGSSRAELVIAAGEQPNAFAGPSKQGPIVGINLGMIKLLGIDWDAYAAIIGHEYAHLKLNHSGIRQEREQIRRGVSEVLGVVLGVAGVPLGGTIANVATTAVATTYTRDEERDADQVGLDYAIRAGFDPHGAVRAWQKMMAASRGLSVPFLSTHPQSEERLETMKALSGSR
jgi:predicted Zn-dependent protease